MGTMEATKIPTKPAAKAKPTAKGQDSGDSDKADKMEPAAIVPASSLEISAPSGLASGVRTLEQYGTLDSGRFIMRPDVSCLEWVTLVLPAAVVANEGAQFTLADALLAGYKWRDVEAIDLATGQPADEDKGYNGTAGIVPFSYSQIAEILDRPAQTIANYLSVARRFGPESRTLYPAARFTHYAACAARDLPDDFVDRLLLRAGRGGPDGLSVAGIMVEVANFRRARDEAARGKAEDLRGGGETKAAPKPDPKPAKGVALRGEVIGPRSGMLMSDAVVTCRKPLRDMLATQSELDETAAAVVGWLYKDAPESVLLGALAYRMAVDSGEAPF